MKRADRRGFDEGWLLAAVLCLILAVCAAVYVSRLPRRITAEPVHFVSGPLVTSAPKPIDVNSADAERLAELPGIGETLAERIIEYREENGSFTCPEELLNVEGIGDGKLSELQGHIACQNP